LMKYLGDLNDTALSKKLAFGDSICEQVTCGQLLPETALKLAMREDEKRKQSKTDSWFWPANAPTYITVVILVLGFLGFNSLRGKSKVAA